MLKLAVDDQYSCCYIIYELIQNIWILRLTSLLVKMKRLTMPNFRHSYQSPQTPTKWLVITYPLPKVTKRIKVKKKKAINKNRNYRTFQGNIQFIFYLHKAWCTTQYYDWIWVKNCSNLLRSLLSAIMTSFSEKWTQILHWAVIS